MLAPAPAPALRPASAVTLTQSGRGLDLLSPDPGQITIRDIASHLAKICRFSGACRTFYSVAQHSVLVATLLRDRGPLTALYGLLHDAHEAYLGDITRPAREALGALGEGAMPFQWLEERLDAAVHAAIGIAWPLDPSTRRTIGEADMRALATEKRDLMPDEPDWPGLPAPWRAVIKPMSWERAEQRFCEVFDELADGIGLKVSAIGGTKR